MLTIKRILIPIIVAYALQILITYLFISSITLSKKENIDNKNTQIRKTKSEENNFSDLEIDVLEQTKIYFDGNYKLPCKIISEDAVSAIRRANTQYCRQKIANISCLIQSGAYYPDFLPHYCPNNGMQYGRYLGCYADTFETRILPDYKKTYVKTNTRNTCLDKCVLEGFPYAGVQFAKECFCGKDMPPSSSKLNDNACDMACSGAPDELCGGELSMNVFETGIAKTSHKKETYPSKNTTKESARIVFLLTISGRALRQVNRLINALYRTHHYIYIHVDARFDYLYRKLSALEKRFPNIKMVTPNVPTIWGGTSLLEVLLSSMRNLFTFGWEWDFVINLSESNFPIKSLESLGEFLSVNKGNNFLGSQSRGSGNKIINPSIYKTFMECEERMWLIANRTLPKQMITDVGSDWMVLSKEFVSYIVGPKDEFLSGLEIVYNHTVYAPESYFHTVLRNSRFCNTKVNSNLHLTNWNRTQGCKCQNRHIVDWCGCSPMVFKLEHWKNITNPKSKIVYFGRKFEPIINIEIINKVEHLIGVDDHNLINNLDSYWQSVYNIEDNISSKDDLLLSHAKSITRINSYKVNNEGCHFVPGEVIEITLYNKADTYVGNLVLHKVSSEGKDIILETLYKPKKNTNVNANNNPDERIKIFKVSSQYDQKEQMFRNFGDILGPFTEPVLVYEISPNVKSKTENFNIHWIDPDGRIASINNITVNLNNYTNFINSNLTTPILPGIWTVYLYQDSKCIFQTKFLITPYECFLRKPLSSEKAFEINGGSQKSYPQFSNDFFLNENTEKVKPEISSPNAKKINDHLREWIDELSIQFYEVVKSCISQSGPLKEPMRCGENVIDVCELTEWSSLSPDPKGSVGNLNKSTGKLVRL